jgi:hypothetical protein
MSGYRSRTASTCSLGPPNKRRRTRGPERLRVREHCDFLSLSIEPFASFERQVGPCKGQGRKDFADVDRRRRCDLMMSPM